MTNRFRFSEAKVRNLPPPNDGGRTTYYDTEQPGLQLRVTSTGVKTFSVLRRVRGGSPIRLTIGRWPVDWSQLRLSELSREQVTALHSRLHSAGKGVTANRVVELLRAIFNFAIREGYVESNPAETITPVAEVDRTRFLQSDELPVFLAALEQESQPWPDFFKVALYVGYRRSAVAAMRWQDVDLRSGTWSVPGERAKNGEPIVLPVAGQALEILKDRFSKREKEAVWVFPGGGRAGHITQPKSAWSRILKRAKLSNLRIHDLRRTLGSWMANAGVPLQQIGRVLGHKDARSTQVYAHLIVATAADAVTQGHEKMRQVAGTATQQRSSNSTKGNN